MKKIKLLPLLLTYCILSLTINSFCQGQKDIWIIPHYSGLDFSSGEPVELELDFGEGVNTSEGVANANSPDGKLLFYSNGVLVKNANHEIMPNGEDINGSKTSAQGVLTFMDPADSNLHYLITASSGNFTGDDTSVVCVSKIDLSLDGGLGAVTSKNDTLLKHCSEMLTAVYHENGKDIWLLAHEKKSTNFYVWLINENGIQPPLIQPIGRSHNGLYDAIGCMSFDITGTQLAVAAGLLELYDFDRTTGQLSNLRELYVQGSSMITPYDAEFSKSGRYLYVGFRNGDYLMQIDLHGDLGQNLNESVTPLDTADDSGFGFGTILLGPDDKIYVAQNAYDYIGVIENPENEGLDCGFNMDAIYLEHSTYGLPNFLPFYPENNNGGVGISDLNNDASLSIWPNPVTDILKIEDSKNSIERVFIFDSFGRTIYATSANQSRNIEINTTNIASGNYILRVETSTQIFSSKLKIQH